MVMLWCRSPRKENVYVQTHPDARDGPALPRGEHSLRFRIPWAWRVPWWGLWAPPFYCASRVWAFPPPAFWRRAFLRRVPILGCSPTLRRGDTRTRTCVVLLLQSARILSHGAIVYCP